MSFWTAIVLIVAIGAFAKMRNDRLRHGQDPVGFVRPAERDEYTAGLEREVIELRKRVEVLERIATDDTRRLSHEIEKLRDQ